MDAKEGNWDLETQFKLYMHDYMKKKNMTRSAAIFKYEAKLPDHSVVIDDSQKGWLSEWWSFFWDVFVKTHYGSNYMDTPEDSRQEMQSRNSIQPQLGTQGQTSGSSSTAHRIFPSPLPLEEEVMIAQGWLTQPRLRGPHDDEVFSRIPTLPPPGGWPNTGPNSSLEPEISSQAGPSTCGGEASSSRNPAGDNSNLN